MGKIPGEILTIITYGAVVIFGAVANVIMHYIKVTDSNMEWPIKKGIARFIVAIFTGMMFGFLADAIVPDRQSVIYAACGIGAWMGVSGLNKLTMYFEQFVKDKLKIKDAE